MRENRPYGSEGGEGFSPSRPLSHRQPLRTGSHNADARTARGRYANLMTASS